MSIDGEANQAIPKVSLVLIPSVGEPFKNVIIDLVSPLTRTSSGHETP